MNSSEKEGTFANKILFTYIGCVMREFKSLYYKRWVTFTMKCYNALLNVYSY